MFVLGVDLSSRCNSYTYTANSSLFGFTAAPPPPPPPTSYSTISLSTDTASFGSRDSSSYMQAPAAPQLMSTISKGKLKSHKFLDNFGEQKMYTETEPRGYKRHSPKNAT
ncbi:unnamed protein product, partial [Rotaria sp. Silwood2]